MISRKYTITLSVILLTAAAAFVANASGITIFGGSIFRDVNDGLVLDMSLAQSNYTSGTKTFADASGLGNNGIALVAASFAADNYDQSNGATSFTANNYVNVSSLYNTSFPQTAGSIAIWVYGDFSAQDMKAIFDDYDDTRKHIFIRGRSANNGLQIVVQDPVGGYLASSYPILENNKWSFVVVTFNNTTDKLNVFINGVLYSSNTITDGTWVPNAQRTVFAGTGNRFTGLISKVRIYNRDLSLGEVQALYRPRALGGSSLQAGLVGYWPLDANNYNATTGRVSDKTPYENHCTNNGATLTADRTGQANGAMDFNGSTSYLNCGNNNSLKITGNQTYAFWIYPRSFGSRRNPIDKAYGGEGTITLETSGAFNYYWGTGGGNTTPYTSVNSGAGLITNQWTHVALVRDLTNNRIVWYFNGAPVSTSTPSYGAAVASTNNLSIGDGYTSPIDGLMSDVRIYNRALSEAEIQTLYSAYRPKIMADSLQQGLIIDMPLTTDWTKSETAGSQIMTDKTPYSRDGQNNSATISSEGASFSGSANWVSIPYGAGIDPSVTPISFSMWVKPNVLTDAMFFSASYSPRLYFGVQGGDWEMGIQNSAWGAGPTDATTNWTHVVVTMDGVYANMYINGVYNHQKAYTAYNFLADFNVGRTQAGTYYFNGSVSNLKIYNRALSAAEVTSLYEKGR
ncbi:MAG: LamG domain-containing protein [Candidatus Falkowbacteria bacterium]|nr:MAG: LamG domain-containing protein [Candidatus Falkowbacteria bacterium]